MKKFWYEILVLLVVVILPVKGVYAASGTVLAEQRIIDSVVFDTVAIKTSVSNLELLPENLKSSGALFSEIALDSFKEQFKKRFPNKEGIDISAYNVPYNLKNRPCALVVDVSLKISTGYSLLGKHTYGDIFLKNIRITTQSGLAAFPFPSKEADHIKLPEDLDGWKKVVSQQLDIKFQDVLKYVSLERAGLQCKKSLDTDPLSQ